MTWLLVVVHHDGREGRFAYHLKADADSEARDWLTHHATKKVEVLPLSLRSASGARQERKVCAECLYVDGCLPQDCDK